MTAVIAIILNVLLLFEQRATRNVAQVEAYPQLRHGTVLALRLENYGPAPARKVALSYRLLGSDRRSLAEKRHGDAVLLAGRHTTFLPDVLLFEQTNKSQLLNDLADQGLWLEAEWSWQDERRRWFFLGPATHHGQLSTAIDELRQDFFGGWSVREEDLVETVERIANELERIRKLAAQFERDLRRD